MKLWRRLPLILFISMGLIFLAIGCDDDEEESPPPVGHLSLGTDTLDFGESIEELDLILSNTGDATLTWNISSIPSWADTDPANGTIEANGQDTISVSINRTDLDPGTATATLVINSDFNDDSLTLSVFVEEPPPPEGHLTLGDTLLNFGETVNEMLTRIRNTGDAELTWEITPNSIPYWINITPTDGVLQASSSKQLTVTVFRTAVDPGETTAALLFYTDYNDDSLTVSINRMCSVLGDDFNEGNAADWNVTAANLAQGDGYILLDPNNPTEAACLMQNIPPTIPSTISARFRRTAESVTFREYGILLEDDAAYNALYFTIYVDNDTNYVLEQLVRGVEIGTLYLGYTDLISTDPEIWNILRLELFQDGQVTYASGYAGASDQKLFDSVEVSDGFDTYVRMGIRSEEYTIHADWFCAND